MKQNIMDREWSIFTTFYLKVDLKFTGECETAQRVQYILYREILIFYHRVAFENGELPTMTIHSDG